MRDKTSDGTMTASTKSNKIVEIIIGLLSLASYGVAFALPVYVVYAQGRGLATNATTISIPVFGSALVAGFLALVFVFKIPYHATGRAKYATGISRTTTINTASLFFSLGIRSHVLRIALIAARLARYLVFRCWLYAAICAETLGFQSVMACLASFARPCKATRTTYSVRDSWLSAIYTTFHGTPPMLVYHKLGFASTRHRNKGE